MEKEKILEAEVKEEPKEEMVSKTEYDNVVAEKERLIANNEKLLKAVNELLRAMSDRYVQDIVKQLGLDDLK